MRVPVVEVGNVRVRVSNRPVLVRMNVPHPARQARVNVRVMAVVVPVTMRVP